MRKKVSVPFITVEVMEGRTLDEKRKFVAEVTAAAVSCLRAAPENVRIRFVAISPDDIARGGELLVDRQRAKT